MSIFKSGNPALSEKRFQNTVITHDGEVMTERGTLNKFFFLFIMVMASASFTWSAFYQGKDVKPWMIGGAIGGLIVAIIMAFKPKWAQYLAPAYGLLEGVFIGAISALYNQAFAQSAPGIIMQAVVLTFGTVIAMFILYRTGVIKATERFKSIVITATMGIAIFYLLAMVMRMFGVDIAFLHEGSMLGNRNISFHCRYSCIKSYS
jgi:uncharacterized YccA/Bax inhibitor family protein